MLVLRNVTISYLFHLGYFVRSAFLFSPISVIFSCGLCLFFILLSCGLSSISLLSKFDTFSACFKFIISSPYSYIVLLISGRNLPTPGDVQSRGHVLQNDVMRCMCRYNLSPSVYTYLSAVVLTNEVSCCFVLVPINVAVYSLCRLLYCQVTL